MGSNQSNTAKLIQSVTDNIFQSTQEICTADCTAIQSGNTIIISGSDTGNVNLTNQCSASASCAMNQQLNNQVSSIMSALAEQENTTSSLWPVSFKFDNKNNKVTIRQAITNNITQLMQSICQSTSDNIQDNNVIVFTDSSGGNITLSNKGSANSTCTMNNVARQVAFNQQTSKTNQTAEITSVFTTIIIIIVVLIIIGALVALLFIGPVGLRNLFGSGEEKGKEGGGDSGGGSGESQSELVKLLSSSQGGEGGGAAEASGAAEAGGLEELAPLALL
jgi:hypothetical protein